VIPVGLADVFFWILVAGMVATIIAIIVQGSLGGGSGASMPGITALHDLSPSDKQAAIEIVVEEKAGKKWMEQESGKGKDPAGKEGAITASPGEPSAGDAPPSAPTS
jgi:hypothetical protein